MKRSSWRFAWAVLALSVFCGVAGARDAVPVYGPARAAVDDEDLLGETILDVGALAVTPDRPWQVFIGDGLTPGGVPIHADGCVTNFNGIHVATTNLDMGGWSVTWGPWNAHGDVNEWDLGYGKTETWLRFVRNTGEAYLHYEFSIVSSNDWRFECAWSDAETLPVLEVSTNLMEGFAAADPATATYARLDASHVRIDFVPGDATAYFFRLFAATRMAAGIYADETFHAGKGVTVPEGQGITMGTNTWDAWPDVGGIATNAANAAVAPVEGLAVMNAGNIATNAESIAANAAAIAANSATIASNAVALTAITNALGQRVSEFEAVQLRCWMEMSTNSDNNVWLVPTNLPTRCLDINIDGVKFTSTNNPLTVRVPSTWTPTKPTQIRILVARPTTNLRINLELGTGRRASNWAPATSGRQAEFHWLPEAGAWRFHWVRVESSHTFYTEAGAVANNRLETLKSTIEDWIEWRKQQPW